MQACGHAVMCACVHVCMHMICYTSYIHTIEHINQFREGGRKGRVSRTAAGSESRRREPAEAARVIVEKYCAKPKSNNYDNNT